MKADEFGQRFQAARQAAGFTQQAAADLLGIPQPRVAEYESGRRVPPTLRLLEIMRVLGLDPQIMFPEFWTSQRPRNCLVRRTKGSSKVDVG